MLGIAMVAAAVLSCKKDEIKQETLEVSPSKDLQFLAKGNEDAVLTISASASSYEVDAEDWVITRKNGNELSVNVEDNKSAERSCDMTISAGTAEPVVIKITQAAGEADAISVAPTSLLFRASGDEPKKLTVTTNVEGWTYVADFGKNEQEDWFTVTPDDADPKSLTVTVTDYTETDGERTGSIDFSAGDAKTSVRVTQTAKDKVEVTPSEPLTFSWNDAEGVALEVTTTANSWDAAVDTDWITTKKENSTLTISVSPNDSESSRGGKVTVSAGNAKPVEIQVTQTGKPAPVAYSFKDPDQDSDKSVKITAESGETTIVLNPSFTLASPVEDDAEAVIASVDELDYWNMFNDPDCLQFPAENLTLPDGGRVTVPAGKAEAPVQVTLNLDGLEFSTSYLLVLKVQSSSDNIKVGPEYFDRIYYVITTAPEPAKPVVKTIKNIAILEVNDVNPLSALEIKFTDGTPYFDGVVLFSSNIQFNESTRQVELYHNPNVQALLDDADTYIRPLQDAGMKVYLSLLCNNDEAWLSNLLPETAQKFSKLVANAVETYRLDGVMLDDEHKAFGGSNYPDIFYEDTDDYHLTDYRNGEFGYYLKQELQKISWDPVVMLYQANGEEWSSVNGVPVADFLDVLISDHNIPGTAQFYTNMGLTKDQIAYRTVNARTLGTSKGTLPTPPDKWGTWVTNVMERGSYFGWYNLNIDPTSGEGYFNWTNNTVHYFQFLAYYMYDGAEIATPTGYYKKINPGTGDGKFDPNRYEYDGFYSGSDWRDYLP